MPTTYTALTTVPTTENPTLLGILQAEIAPSLLVLKAQVATSSAAVRLYCYDADHGKWFPSKVAAQTLTTSTDNGRYELRFVTAGIAGYYALVRESGTGTVTYTYRPGRA